MTGGADTPPGVGPGGGRASSAQRGALVASLRRLAPLTPRERARVAAAPFERCDLCGTRIPDEHRHLLHLTDRRILTRIADALHLRGDETVLEIGPGRGALTDILAGKSAPDVDID